MSKKTLALIGVLLFILCYAVLVIFGRTYTVNLGEPYLSSKVFENAEKIRIEIDNKESACAEMTGYIVEDGRLKIRFSPVRCGKMDVSVFADDNSVTSFSLYTHLFGLITYNTFFGDSRGDIAVPAAMLLFFGAVLYFVLQRYRSDVKRSMYQYRNVMELGLIIFLCFLLLCLIRQFFVYQGLIDSAEGFLGIVHYFSMIVLPAAFVISLLVTASSVSLMRKEGRTWRNMLGIFLGVGLCLLTILPLALGEYLQWSPSAFMDVHNERGAGLYIETLTEGVISMLVTYLECILIGTIVFGIKAARHIPAFDKDYILILGSQIRKDGTLTPLLRGRADRAMEFARMQKEKTGRDLVFVPSGGQGADEVMAEADAIKNYLLSAGIPEEHILAENKSADTRENILNSARLIRKHADSADVSAAFSTTNYHVFRAGLIAQTQGVPMEGIGSPTKRYFWINAFVREFIATLVSERKKHAIVIIFVTLMIILATGIKLLNAFL